MASNAHLPVIGPPTGVVLNKLKNSYQFKQLAPFGKKIDHVLIFYAILGVAVCCQLFVEEVIFGCFN